MPARSNRRGLSALLALTALTGALSACSSGASSSDIRATTTPFSGGLNSPSTAPIGTAAITSPSPGAVLSSDRIFNFVAPSGWNVTNNPKAILDLSSATLAHSVAPTIVVTRSSQTPAPVLGDVLQMSLMQARQEGASVKRLPDRAIGGENAVGFTGESTQNGLDVTRTYYMVAHDRALYIVAATGATRDASALEGTLNSLLASWSWTKAGDKDSTASGTTPAAVPTTTSTSTSPTSSSTSSSSETSSPSNASKSSATALPSSTSTKR